VRSTPLLYHSPTLLPMALELRTAAGSFTLDQTADGLTLDGQPVQARVERVGPSTYLLLVETAEGRIESRTVTVEPQGAGRIRATVGGTPVVVEVKDETALLLERFGTDPAVASSIFVTAFTDVCGFVLLLGLAGWLLL